MKNRWLALLGTLVFSVTLALIVGSQLAQTAAAPLVFGVAVGVAAGLVAGGAAAVVLLRGAGSANRSGTTTVVLPDEQARLLIKMLNSRRQADPDEFPLVADRERRFTTVGGALLDDSADGD